ncbi:hypothetical protein QZH41_009381, partial [Actinostola sp. cb2023]
MKIKLSHSCIANCLKKLKTSKPSGPDRVAPKLLKRSVLGPILFSLFCNGLPYVANDDTGDIHMYADDMTLYVIAKTPDEVATALNVVLVK